MSYFVYLFVYFFILLCTDGAKEDVSIVHSKKTESFLSFNYLLLSYVGVTRMAMGWRSLSAAKCVKMQLKVQNSCHTSHFHKAI